MKLWPPRRKMRGREKVYCLYCDEELGADPARCLFCGTPRANPLGATSVVRHDVPDPLWGSAPRPPATKPSGRRQFVWLLVSLPAIGAIGADPHVYGYGRALLIGSMPGFLLLIYRGNIWAARTNRVKWAVFFSVAEMFTAACLAIGGAIASAVLLGWLSVSRVTSCYGACTGRVGGVSAFTLTVAESVILALLLLVVLVTMVRKRDEAQLAATTEQPPLSRSGRSSLPNSAPWNAAGREWAGRSTRQR